MRAATAGTAGAMTAPAGQGIMTSVAQPLVDRAVAATTPPAQTAKPVELPPPHPVIVPATDLGGVGVLKHGNLFLLSDPFGDVHSDSRGLGLYDLDTRVLSCAVLRINGVRPTLLRTQAAANHIATIQLTNPELRRDPAIKNEIGAAIASRAISVTRRRWIANGLAERIEVTNYSAFSQRIELELELDADAADIFEVRGRIREHRGRYLPTLTTPESVTFAYEGLDGFVRRTLVTMSARGGRRQRGSWHRPTARAPCACAGSWRSSPAVAKVSAGRWRPSSPRAATRARPRRSRSGSRSR